MAFVEVLDQKWSQNVNTSLEGKFITKMVKNGVKMLLGGFPKDRSGQNNTFYCFAIFLAIFGHFLAIFWPFLAIVAAAATLHLKIHIFSRIKLNSVDKYLVGPPLLKKNRNFMFEIVFFGFFKNDNILSSKLYTVTKSEIFPQRKLGSLRNLKLKLIRH